MKRYLILTVLLLACGLKAWPQALVNGVQPSAVNGITVATGAQLNGITLTAPGGGGGGTATFVQDKPDFSANAVTLNSNVTVGNIELVGYYNGGGSGETITFTSSLGNTFTTLKTANLATDGDTIAIGCAPVTTGGSETITLNVNGSPTGGRVVAYEFQTTHGTCTQDVTAVASDTTGVTTCSSGSLTTTTANDVLFGICGDDGNQTSAMTAGSGWSNALSPGPDPTAYFLLGEARVAATPGAFTATSGSLTTAMEQSSIMVAIKP